MERGKVPEDVDRLITAAITQNRQVRFWYHGKERIVEPHDYGIQNGRHRLLAFQIGGQSSSKPLPGWRLIDISEITNLEILPRTFAGNRPAPSGQHHKWDQLFLRAS